MKNFVMIFLVCAAIVLSGCPQKKDAAKTEEVKISAQVLTQPFFVSDSYASGSVSFSVNVLDPEKSGLTQSSLHANEFVAKESKILAYSLTALGSIKEYSCAASLIELARVNNANIILAGHYENMHHGQVFIFSSLSAFNYIIRLDQ